jgi:hypothetical protein
MYKPLQFSACYHAWKAFLISFIHHHSANLWQTMPFWFMISNFISVLMVYWFLCSFMTCVLVFFWPCTFVDGFQSLPFLPFPMEGALVCTSVGSSLLSRNPQIQFLKFSRTSFSSILVLLFSQNWDLIPILVSVYFRFVLGAVLVVILEPTVELAQFQLLYVEPMASGKLQFRLHNSKYFIRALYVIFWKWKTTKIFGKLET